MQKYSRFVSLFSLTILLCLSLPGATLANWPSDPTVNLPLSFSPGPKGGFDSASIEIVNDGSDGAIIAWYDNDRENIYAQHVDADGTPLWPQNGLAISSSPTIAGDYIDGRTGQFRVVSDGKRGVIFVWGDTRNGGGDIYAQRFNGAGSPMWGRHDAGVAVVSGEQSWPELTADGNGGAVFTWRDQRTAPSDSYIQWIGADGRAKWQANGIDISSAKNHQYYPKITQDDHGGVIVAWMDDRSSPEFYHWEIYAQRFDSSGSPQWQADGVLVRGQSGEAFINPDIVTDGEGGAVIAWRRNSTDCNFSGPCPNEVFAQRLDGDGKKIWESQGVTVLPPGEEPFDGRQYIRTLVPDHQGGAYYVWYGSYYGDFGDTSNLQVQHLGSNGSLRWGLQGQPVVGIDTADLVEEYVAVEDGIQGILIVWENWTSGEDDKINIRAQKFNRDGIRLWGDNGVAVSTAASFQFCPKIAPDSKGGAIVTWNDDRNGDGTMSSRTDVYAQRVFNGGRLHASIPLAPLYLLLDGQTGFSPP